MGGAAYAQRTADPKITPPIDVSGPQLDEAVAGEMARAQRTEELAARPEAKRQRAASRDRYANSSKRGAFRLARREARLEKAQSVEEPASVEKYVGSNLALIEEANGTKGLVSSTLPLRDRDENRRTVPVETDLKSEGGMLEPDNALTDYAIGRKAQDGVAFKKSRIEMRVASADEESSAMVLDEKAFFADVRKDLDHMVVAQPQGVQTFQTIRSVKATEQYALGFSLPDGARLRPASLPLSLNAPVTGMRPQFIEIIEGDKRLATVSLPVAWDAQDRPVETGYEIDGDEVRITVRHRTKDLAYPITVDPYVYEQQSFNQGSDFTGWVYSGNRPYYIAGLAGDSYYGRGLYLYNYANTAYSAGEYGQWTYTAPTVPGFESEGGFIYKVDFGDIAHTLYQAQACAVEGIYRTPAFRWESPAYKRGPQTTDVLSSSPTVDCGYENYNYDVHGINNPLPNDGGPPPSAERAAAGNSAVFQYYMQYNGTRSSGQALFVGRTVLHMSDRGVPRLSVESPTGWVNSGTVRAIATDYGLGMRRIDATVPSGGSSPPPTMSSCGEANLRNAPCPRTSPLEYPVSLLAEGTSETSIVASDVVDNRGRATSTVKVDRSAPRWPEDVAGAGYISPGGGDARIEWPDAEDPDAPSGEELSGVDRYVVRYRVEGQTTWSTETTTDTSIDLTGQTVGTRYEIKLQATTGLATLALRSRAPCRSRRSMRIRRQKTSMTATLAKTRRALA